jgi:hypothetical protein
VSRASRTLVEELIGLPLHFLIAVCGGTLLVIVSGGVMGRACSTIGFPFPDLGLIYNPIVWLVPVFLGIVTNRLMRHRSACLVGIVGALLIPMFMRSEISIIQHSEYMRNLTHGHYWRYEFQQLFSSDDRTCSDSECLGKVLFTLPFLTSVAYSIGAWLGLKFGKMKSSSAPRLNSDEFHA